MLRIIIDSRESEWCDGMGLCSPVHPAQSFLRPGSGMSEAPNGQGTCPSSPPLRSRLPPDVCVEKRQLVLGDVHIMIDDAVVVIVERKTLNDLLHSQQDTRLAEQMGRLVAQAPHCSVVLLVEGCVDQRCEDRVRLWKIMENVRHEYPQIEVRQTADLATSTEWVAMRLERAQKWASASSSSPEACGVPVCALPRKGGVNAQTLVVYILSSIPGISHATATALCESFGWTSARHLLTDLEKTEVRAKLQEWSPPFGHRRLGVKRGTAILRCLLGHED